MNRYRQISQGFTLLEVLVAMLVALVGLLGLAHAQAKALQYSSSSLTYTVAVIQANNTLERLWPSLCALQKGQQSYDDAFKALMQPQQGLDPSNFNVVLPDHNFTMSPYGGAAPQELADFLIVVNWNENRFNDGLANTVEIVSSFPWLRNGGACE